MIFTAPPDGTDGRRGGGDTGEALRDAPSHQDLGLGHAARPGVEPLSDPSRRDQSGPSVDAGPRAGPDARKSRGCGRAQRGLGVGRCGPDGRAGVDGTA